MLLVRKLLLKKELLNPGTDSTGTASTVLKSNGLRPEIWQVHHRQKSHGIAVYQRPATRPAVHRKPAPSESEAANTDQPEMGGTRCLISQSATGRADAAIIHRHQKTVEYPWRQLSWQHCRNLTARITVPSRFPARRQIKRFQVAGSYPKYTFDVT